ncbi:hypothetical protein L681_18585 [Stenotrophomonas maltophilia MF89]|nr:hypothetical protein L681_18585 [Stenotrophomonas maltophilia MF89]
MGLCERNDCAAIAGMENELAWTTRGVVSFRRLLEVFARNTAIGDDLLGHRRCGSR